MEAQNTARQLVDPMGDASPEASPNVSGDVSAQVSQDVDFEPKMIAFLCNWCSYTGADLAGTSRIQYPANVRTIRVMCSGSVDAVHILRALVGGADGVLVGGCHPGDCHYISGNYKQRRRMAVLKAVLRQFGFEEERVWFRFISASEGRLFASTISEMVDNLKKLGPNPLRQQWDI